MVLDADFFVIGPHLRDQPYLAAQVDTVTAHTAHLRRQTQQHRDRSNRGWHHRNGYQGDSPIPDSRIDYILAGLPRQGRGKVLSAALAGTGPVAGIWPSDHFAVVADLQE